MVGKCFTRLFGLVGRPRTGLILTVALLLIYALIIFPVKEMAAGPKGFDQPISHPIRVRDSASNKSSLMKGIQPNVNNTNPSGFYPAQIRKAYGIDLLANKGAGKKIAIIDAYGSSTIQADFNVFCAQFGLPSLNITIHNIGTITESRIDWALETALDVEWAHAIAPEAEILLVVSPDTSGLLDAVDYATSQGANVVSMSWGTNGEFSDETQPAYESHFQHAGTLYVASSCDVGSIVVWPAVSPYVVAVGGTTLTTLADGTYVSETAWSGSGGGKSAYFSRPFYQNGFSSSLNRKVPDVAFDADSTSGVAVYDTANGGWIVVGGTSVSAPCWAAMSVLDSPAETSLTYSWVYSKAAGPGYPANYHDIVNPINHTLDGYDLVTGLGSPKANYLVPGTASKLSFATQPAGSTRGVAFTPQPIVKILDASGNTVPTSTAAVTLAITGGTGTAGATLSGTSTINAINGVATFTGLNIDLAGYGYSLTATSDGLTPAVSNTFAVTSTPGTPASLSISQPAGSTLSVDSIFSTQPWILVSDEVGNPVSGATVTASLASGTGLLRTTLTAVSDINGLAKFTGLGYSKTDAFQLRFTCGGLIINSAVSGPLTAGTPASIRVETFSNGSGTILAPQSVISGNSLTVYAVTRDQFGNFVANAPASWSFSTTSGGVAVGDLTVSGDTKSAIMTGYLAGTGVIHVVNGSLTSADSGIITVTAGPAAFLSINQAPASSLSVDSVFSTQPWILVSDAVGNPVNGTTVTASLASGNGVLRTTLIAVSGIEGLVKFTDLGYNRTDAFKLHFTAGSLNVDSLSLGPLPAGSATLVKVETAADGSGTVVPSQSLTSGNSLSVYAVTRDQFGNFVANAAATTWALSIFGNVVAADLVPASDSKSAVLTGHRTGTAIIAADLGSLPKMNSGLITVIAGPAASLTVYQAPASSSSVDFIFTTQPWILVSDTATNPVSGTNVTASLAGGSGSLRTTLTAVSDSNGLAKFTDLGYSKTDAFQLHFAAGALSVNATAFGPLVAGAASKVRVETAANGNGIVVPAQNLTAGASLTVYSITRDQYNNYLANIAADSWSFAASPVGVVSGDLVASGDNKSAVMTGHLVGTGIIHVVSGSLAVTNSGTITVVAGAPVSIRVETVGNGSGNVVPAQNLTAGSTLTVYSISRDQYNNFVANMAADSWSFAATPVGVVGGDLVASGENKSAVMTGHLVGTGIIHTSSGSLTITDSGTITVIPGPAASLTVNQAPASSSSVDFIFTTQPWILVSDAATNRVSGATVTASLASGTGVLRTTLTAVSGTDGLAKFTDLGYSKTDAFQLHFAAGGLSVNATAFGPLAAGAATKVRVETAANGSGGVVPSQNLTSGSTLTVYSISRDQYNNFVANIAADTNSWSLTNITGNVVGGDLVASSDNKSAVITGHLVGTGIIKVVSGSLVSTNSGTINVIAGAASKVRVETAANGSGTIVPAQNLTSGYALMVYSISRDQFDNFVANIAADSWSVTSISAGVVIGDLVASGDKKSAVMTGHLVGTGIIHFVSGSLACTDSGIISVVAPVVYSGGGGGGGGGAPIVNSLVTVSGLSATPTLKLNSNGQAQTATSLKTDDGKASFEIAQNTILKLSNGVIIKTLSAKVLESPPQPPPQNVIFAAYEFGPEGAFFNPPITLTLSYDPKNLPDGVAGDTVSLAYWDGSDWVTVESKIDFAAGTVTAQISHFSQYALTVKLLPPAKFDLSGFKITPSEIKPGEVVTIQSVVSNTGGKAGVYTVSLKVNGVEVESRAVTLEANKSETVVFTLQRQFPGDFSIDLNGIPGKFVVLAPPPSPIPEITPTPEVLTPQPAAVEILPATSEPMVTSPIPETGKPLSPLWLVLGGLAIMGGIVILTVSRKRTKKGQTPTTPVP